MSNRVNLAVIEGIARVATAAPAATLRYRAGAYSALDLALSIAGPAGLVPQLPATYSNADLSTTLAAGVLATHARKAGGVRQLPDGGQRRIVCAAIGTGLACHQAVAGMGTLPERARALVGRFKVPETADEAVAAAAMAAASMLGSAQWDSAWMPQIEAAMAVAPELVQRLMSTMASHLTPRATSEEVVRYVLWLLPDDDSPERDQPESTDDSGRKQSSAGGGASGAASAGQPDPSSSSAAPQGGAEGQAQGAGQSPGSDPAQEAQDGPAGESPGNSQAPSDEPDGTQKGSGSGANAQATDATAAEDQAGQHEQPGQAGDAQAEQAKAAPQAQPVKASGSQEATGGEASDEQSASDAAVCAAALSGQEVQPQESGQDATQTVVLAGAGHNLAERERGVSRSNPQDGLDARVMGAFLRALQAKRKRVRGLGTSGPMVAAGRFWRFAQLGDRYVFRRPAQRAGIDVAVHIMLDRSSSMASRMKSALDISAACMQALRRIAGVKCGLSIFPAVTGYSQTMMTYGGNVEQAKWRMRSVYASGGTPLLGAMREQVPELLAQKAQRHILLVVTDGMPHHAEACRAFLQDLQRAPNVIAAGIGIGLDVSSVFDRSACVHGTGDLAEAAAQFFADAHVLT